jgi:hypothetical protein
MKPQSNPVAGFYPINNLRIMPENSNCSSLVDVKRWKFKHAGGSRTFAWDAVDGQCRVETLSSDLCHADKKRGGALAAPPEERKTTRVGKSRYSSFTSSHRFFYRSNSRAVPIACLFKIAQL